MRWKNFGETTIEEGHKAFFSGKEDKHEHGVGFLVHMDIMKTLMGCRTVRADLFVCHHHHQSLCVDADVEGFGQYCLGQE